MLVRNSGTRHNKVVSHIILLHMLYVLVRRIYKNTSPDFCWGGGMEIVYIGGEYTRCINSSDG